MKRFLLLLAATTLFSLPSLATTCPSSFQPLGYPASGCTVNSNNWTWVFPDQTGTTVNFNFMLSAGWHRDSFDPFTGCMVTYQEVPNEVTFSYELFSYCWQPTTVAVNPWIHEFTNNDAVPGGFSTASYHALVTATGIAATDQTINGTVSSCTATTAKFFSTGKMYLRIDNEIIKYTGYTCSGTTITFTVATSGRGVRGTSAVCHNPGGSVVNGCATVGNGDIWQAAPDPQFWNRATGAFTASAPDAAGSLSIEGGHPFHETAMDTTHERWIRFDGKPEVGSYEAYTEFYNFNSGCTNGTCVPANASAPTWTILSEAADNTRFLQNTSGTKSDFSTDGAIEYDNTHDGMMQFGGGSSASNVTNIMCFTVACESLVSGAPTTGGPNGDGTYLWASPTVTCYAVGGATWSGISCNGAGGLPDKRIWHSMVWDSNIKRYVLFGGGTGFNTPFCLPTSVTNPVKWDHTNCPTEPNDVFIYNPEDASWRQVILNPNGDNPAPARRPAFTYNSDEKVEVLWEGPLTYDASGNPWVGRYESGIYKLTISNVPANGVTGSCTSYTTPGACATGQWTIQGATGCQSNPCASGPPLPYSQESTNSPNQGCAASNDLLLTLGVPGSWQASHAYTLNQIVDNQTTANGKTSAWLQEVTTAGTSGGTAPTWSLTTGGTTTDGTVTWTNKGPIFFACDHSTENIVYDNVHKGYVYEDIDTSTTGTYARVQVWQIPAVNVTTSTSPNAPPAPTLTLGQVGASVDLSWTVASGATIYQVYKCTGGTATCGTPPASTYPTGWSTASPATNSLCIGSQTTICQTITGLTAGTLYGFVVVASNGAGPSPASNQVTATPATAADISPSPTSLTFGSQNLNTTSAAQTVTLSNPSNTTAVTINSFAISGDFAFTNVNCPISPSTLAASGSCTVNITFTPTATGTRNGTFTITDTGTSSPQSVALSGTGARLTPNIIRGGTIRH